jgi:hypothetical protein
VVAAPTTAEAPATAARVSLLMAAGTIGETMRQGLEEAAGSAWSIYLSCLKHETLWEARGRDHLLF